MFIGIEAERANASQKTGVEHYAKQLILHLAQIDSRNQYILYLRSAPQDWLLGLPKNFKLKVMPFPFFWTQLRISLEMLLNPPDVLLVPASALPFIHPKKSIITIHDLAWKYYPETFDAFNRWFLNWSTGFAAKRASSVIAVSASTKTDLIDFYGISPAKVKIVHHGFDASFLENTGEDLPKGLPDEYVLYLSTLQPRKNPQGLIDAFLLMKKAGGELKQKLVIVGKLGWKYGEILEKIKDNSEFVVYLNHIPDAQRNTVLRKARLMVLPSFYEGFGMTILEAFAAGVPVATSNLSSMPEVAGNAAEYFDPHDAESIKKAILNVLNNPELARSLVDRGRTRLLQFSWEKCARETLEIIAHD
jgi:glycosyltransferase involved in cell wall biosynthesis